jgi:protein gp37
VISGTSTVSACRFVEPIYLICELTRKYSECFYQFNTMVKDVNMLMLLYNHIFKNTANKQIFCTVLQQLPSHAYIILQIQVDRLMRIVVALVLMVAR